MKQMYIGARGRGVFVGFARDDDRFRLIRRAIWEVVLERHLGPDVACALASLLAEDWMPPRRRMEGAASAARPQGLQVPRGQEARTTPPAPRGRPRKKGSKP